jgi:phytoene desaturase (3,4-didehydrolycopene-forming)
VGASTHPGTGVPVCLAGAKLTTEQILEDCKVQKPWGPAEEKNIRAKRMGRELDKVRMNSISGREPREKWFYTILFILIAFFLTRYLQIL